MSPDPAEPTVFRCGVFIDGSGRPARTDVALVVDAGRISSVDPWTDEGEHGRPPRSVTDLRDCTVVPGLVDAHAHPCIGYAEMPAWDAAKDDAAGIVAWGLASCQLALGAGVTTMVDVGSPHGLALTVQRLLEAGVATGPRLLAAGPAITTTAGHGCDLGIGVVADGAEEGVRAVRRNVAAGSDLVKIMVTGGADPLSNRRRAQYTQEELDAMVADAHRLGRRVVGHANATEGIARAVRAGIDVVAHCNWLVSEGEGVEVDEDVVSEMIDRRVWIDLNIHGATRGLADADGPVLGWEGSGPPPSDRWGLLQPLRSRGVPLFLTSDGFGPTVAAFPAALVAAGAKWGLPAEELVMLVSSEPARAFGMAADRGTLSPGRLADFVVLPGDLRTDGDALARPLMVYRSGAEVVRNGWARPPELARAAAIGLQAQDAAFTAAVTQAV